MRVEIDIEQMDIDGAPNSLHGRKLGILGHPDEELERGQVLLTTDGFSMVVSRRELAAALRAYEGK